MAYTQMQKITSPSPSQAGEFGFSVAVDGFYAVVGEDAPGDTYLYKRNIEGVWVFQHVFPISGNSVAIYKTHIVIGNGSNNVKVYDRDTYTELQNIDGSGGFGSSVAVDDNYIVIRDLYDDRQWVNGTMHYGVGDAYARGAAATQGLSQLGAGFPTVRYYNV